MKKYFLIMLVVVVGLALTGVVSAADKDAIKAQVDEIAIAIEGGKPAYDAVVQATTEGNWVTYQWDGKEKNAYVRKTKTGVIVGSGY